VPAGTWIELHHSVFRHPKTIRLCKSLSIEDVTAAGHLAALWCWALDALDENGGPITADEVGAGALWHGNARRFARALQRAGYLDEHKNGDFFLHNWPSYSGKVQEKRAVDRERQRKHREKMKLESENVTRDSHTPVTPTDRPLTPTVTPTVTPSVTDERSDRPTDLLFGTTVPAPADAAPPLERFYQASRNDQRVAALIDAARAVGREVSGARIGAMLKKHTPTEVATAFGEAVTRNAASIEDYMQGVLNGRTDTTRRGAARSGAKPAWDDAAYDRVEAYARGETDSVS
jgi:hypothetical protein